MTSTFAKLLMNFYLSKVFEDFLLLLTISVTLSLVMVKVIIEWSNKEAEQRPDS